MNKLTKAWLIAETKSAVRSYFAPLIWLWNVSRAALTVGAGE